VPIEYIFLFNGLSHLGLDFFTLKLNYFEIGHLPMLDITLYYCCIKGLYVFKSDLSIYVFDVEPNAYALI
jgi:hypothetical protein